MKYGDRIGGEATHTFYTVFYFRLDNSDVSLAEHYIATDYQYYKTRSKSICFAIYSDFILLLMSSYLHNLENQSHVSFRQHTMVSEKCF